MIIVIFVEFSNFQAISARKSMKTSFSAVSGRKSQNVRKSFQKKIETVIFFQSNYSILAEK